MRIVIDASVLISGFISRSGGSHQLLNSRNNLIVSSLVIEEYLSFIRKHPALSILAQQFLNQLHVFVIEPEKIGAYCRDPSDDYLVNLAVETSADYLATLDNDLLVLKHVGKTKIAKPEAIMAVRGM